MGNSSTSVTENSSNISAQGAFSFPFWISDSPLALVLKGCHVQTDSISWLGLKIFILVMALPANAGLMWLLLSRRGGLTPSELLGLNVSVMDVLYCLCLPLDIYVTLHQTQETLRWAREALFSLNMFGCPLLLTCMCLERYMAVARPITYLGLGRREYRVALCACAWTTTLAVALQVYFVHEFSAWLYLCVAILLLFVLMLLSLLGTVRALNHSGPGETFRSRVPLKRRALKNIIAVAVPSVVAYSPLVALVPYMAVLFRRSQPISVGQCYALHVLLLFPNLGLFIGPLFYLSRIRQVICRKNGRHSPNCREQSGPDRQGSA